MPVAVEGQGSPRGPARARGAARLSPRQPTSPWPQEQAARRGCDGDDAVPRRS
jgi:hypothetical protein